MERTRRAATRLGAAAGGTRDLGGERGARGGGRGAPGRMSPHAGARGRVASVHPEDRLLLPQGPAPAAPPAPRDRERRHPDRGAGRPAEGGAARETAGRLAGAALAAAAAGPSARTTRCHWTRSSSNPSILRTTAGASTRRSGSPKAPRRYWARSASRSFRAGWHGSKGYSTSSTRTARCSRSASPTAKTSTNSGGAWWASSVDCGRPRSARQTSSGRPQARANRGLAVYDRVPASGLSAALKR